MSGAAAGSRRARRAVVIGFIASLPPVLLFAATFDLDHPLKRQESGVCYAGYNSLCLPYKFGTCSDTTTTECGENGDCPQGETCNFFGRCNATTTTTCSDNGDCPGGESCNLRTASNLWEWIDSQAGIGSTANAVLKISRYVKSSGGLQTYSGGHADVANNFTLEKGAGYLIQVNNLIDGPDLADPDDTDPNDFTLNIRGSHDSSFAITFDEQCQSPGCSGTQSATGITEFCQPYHMISDRASELADEIDALFCDGGELQAGLCTVSQTACTADCIPCVDDADCSGGETCQRTGVCTVSAAPCAADCDPCESDGDCSGEACYRCACEGGANDGELCIVESVSRFDQVTDTLETYAEAPGDDFDLTAGDATRVEVSSTLSEFAPSHFTIDVEVTIESQPPAPCGPQDGGYLRLDSHGTGAHVRTEWHGGDTAVQVPEIAPYRNLVFLYPAAGGHTQVCDEGDPPGLGVCAGNTCPGPGFQDSGGCDLINCGTCGCEIQDGLDGICSGPSTGYTRCVDDDDCATGYSCTRIGDLAPGEYKTAFCNQTHCDGDPTETCGNPANQNCCDQDFTWQEGEKCDIPTEVQCTVLQPSYDFYVTAACTDTGASACGTSASANWFSLTDRGVVPPQVTVSHWNCCHFVCSNDCDTTCDEDSDCDAEETCVSSCLGECSEESGQCLRDTDCDLGERCDRVCPGGGE